MAKGSEDQSESQIKRVSVRLREAHPELLGNVRCGISIGSGWFELVTDLCSKLSKDVIVEQIKEKFGGLRFYVSGATDEDYQLIVQAEDDSRKTCEVCGEPGERRTGGWMRTLCTTHEEARSNP